MEYFLRMKGNINVCDILFESLKETGRLTEISLGWRIILKRILNRIRRLGLDSSFSGNGQLAGCIEHGNKLVNKCETN